MKRWRIAIILGATLIAFVLMVVHGLHAVSERARDVQVCDVCERLAIMMRMFYIAEGHSPQSLAELQHADRLNETDRRIVRELFLIMQHNDWHDTYGYIPSTNTFTFTITVTGPTGWLGGQRRIEKHYEMDRQ
jgi:hypothetical protein